MENTKVTIELTLGEWNTVLSVLGQGPFVSVAPLIEAIRSQAQSQITKPAEEN
jgi:hypothetical protein